MMSTDLFTSENIDRAYRLITTPYVLDILDGLARGHTPAQAAGHGAPPAQVDEALRFLRQLGVVTDPLVDPVALTGNGHRLLAGLAAATDIDPDSPETP